MAYEIHLKQFDGPMDFLIHLIRQAQIDIRDIFVSEITDKYLEAMSAVDELDMDAASDFLDMAATLLYIKSRSLLPVVNQSITENEEETPEQQLIRHLEEYERIKSASAEMETMYETASHSFTKLPDEMPASLPDIDLESVGSNELYSAFLDVLQKAKDKKGIPSERISSVLADRFTIRSCMTGIRSRLNACGAKGIRFYDLFSADAPRMEIIVTFMALLEMLAHGEVSLRQNAPFQPITVLAGNLLSESETENEIYMDEE